MKPVGCESRDSEPGLLMPSSGPAIRPGSVESVQHPNSTCDHRPSSIPQPSPLNTCIIGCVTRASASLGYQGGAVRQQIEQGRKSSATGGS